MKELTKNTNWGQLVTGFPSLSLLGFKMNKNLKIDKYFAINLANIVLNNICLWFPL